jgi:hypothetical protein
MVHYQSQPSGLESKTVALCNPSTWSPLTTFFEAYPHACKEAVSAVSVGVFGDGNIDVDADK